VRTLLAAAIGWAVAGAIAGSIPAAAGQQIADIRQGTNMAVAIAPDGQTLIIDLLGQLWRLPITGGGAEPLTGEDERARHPRYSRDGRHVVYQRLIEGQWDLWLLSLEDGSRRALTASSRNEREPDFSADGLSIVFASDLTGHYCLWTLELATGVLTQLTEEPGNASFPSVSALDQIAYVLDRDGQSSLRVLRPQGVAVELLTSRKALGAPSWRPGGGVIVFNELDPPRSSQLKMLVIADKVVVKPLTYGEDAFEARAAWPSEAEYIYTADGQIWRRRLAESGRQPIHLFAAVTVDAASPPPAPPVLDAAGANRAFGITGLSSSADGRKTAFVALGDLWIHERDDVRQLTNDPYVEADPAFAPDGESIVFAADRGGRMDLWRLALDHDVATQLTFGGGKTYRPSISPDGASIAFLETDELGPWGSSALRILALERPRDVRTLAAELIAPERPVFQSDGRAVFVDSARGPVRVALNPRGAGPGQPAAQPETRPRAASRDGGEEDEEAPVRGLLELADELDLQWSAAPGADEPYVIQAGRLFDGIRGDYRRHVDIHVEGQRIVAVVGRGVKPSPGRVVDARDATVIPGLIDAHAHHSSIAGERLGRAWLSYGVTTVRELSSNLAEALERSESWASGRRLGPRLVVTPTRDSVESREPARTLPVLVASYANLADGFGHSLLRQNRALGIPAWKDPPLLAQLVLGRAAAARYELETSPLDASYQDAVGRIIMSGTVVTPALGALGGAAAPRAGPNRLPADRGYEALFDVAERERWDRTGRSMESVRGLQQTVARLVRGGGSLAVGTDSPAVPYGLGVHIELALLADAGIPNDQVLRLATAQGAFALGLEGQLGTVEQGKLADMVVLTGDPLARIGDTLTISAVVKGGRWLDRQGLHSPP
jgi:Tol biopolymer transport system component